MKQDELVYSIHLWEKDRANGIHYCIMKNGDIFARYAPYYDGVIDNLCMVHNQQKIRDIVFKKA
jgi:hypothetical protein